MVFAKTYSDIPFLSNGRATLALEQIAARAEEKGDGALVDQVRGALDEHGRWREVIDAWVRQGRSRARTGGAAQKVDAEADFVVRTLFGLVRDVARQRPDTEAGQSAARLLDAHFTDPRGHISAGVIAAVIYEEQLPRMRTLHAELVADPERMRLLRVTDWVADLGEILPRYVEALEASNRIAWSDVIGLRNAAYDGLFAVVGLIFAHHRNDRATVAYLLTPLDDQVARAAELARRRRAGQSVPGDESVLSPDEIDELDAALAEGDDDPADEARADAVEGDPDAGPLEVPAAEPIAAPIGAGAGAEIGPVEAAGDVGAPSVKDVIPPIRG